MTWQINQLVYVLIPLALTLFLWLLWSIQRGIQHADGFSVGDTVHIRSKGVVGRIIRIERDPYNKVGLILSNSESGLVGVRPKHVEKIMGGK